MNRVFEWKIMENQQIKPIAHLQDLTPDDRM